MTANPDPRWRPGQADLTNAQLDAWVNWYIGGLDNVTNWEMTSFHPRVHRLLRDRHPRLRQPPRRHHRR